MPEVSVEEVQSKKEFERVAQKEYAPPGALANYFSKARVWLKRNWPTFGGMAALGVAMLSAIGVIAVKVWKRQKTGKSL